MTIFLTVIITLAVLAGLAKFVWWLIRDGITRQQAQIQIWRQAWQIQQTTYDAEQRLRDATRNAMNQILAEARRAENRENNTSGRGGKNHGRS